MYNWYRWSHCSTLGLWKRLFWLQSPATSPWATFVSLSDSHRQEQHFWPVKRSQVCPAQGLCPPLVGIQPLAPTAEAASPPHPQHWFCFQLGNRSSDNFYCYPAKTSCAIRPLPIKVRFYGHTCHRCTRCALVLDILLPGMRQLFPLPWLQTGPIPAGCLGSGSGLGKPASTGPQLHTCRSRYLPPSTWLCEEGGTDAALQKQSLSAFWRKGCKSLYVSSLWPEKCPVKVTVMAKTELRLLPSGT